MYASVSLLENHCEALEFFTSFVCSTYQIETFTCGGREVAQVGCGVESGVMTQETTGDMAPESSPPSVI